MNVIVLNKEEFENKEERFIQFGFGCGTACGEGDGNIYNKSHFGFGYAQGSGTCSGKLGYGFGCDEI